MRSYHSFDETEEDVILTVRTLCPTKWVLIDRETGQTYQGNAGGYWDKLEPKIKMQDEEKTTK